MKPTVSRSNAASVLLCMVGLVTWLNAGPLNPPAGPVASSFKTLTEIEPRTAINAANTPGDADSLYKITQPGSYYLTGNITGVAAKHGIEVVASGVTLDLMGFELLGVPGSLDGVSATVGVSNVEVRGGSVSSWGDEGLDFTNGGSISVADVGVMSCAGLGISVNPDSTVSRCKVRFCAGGIATGINSVVTGCAVDGNTLGGILAWVGCRVVDCAANNNTGNGISANNGSTITGCAATDNTGHGIAVPNGCTISNCSASFNDLNGISTGSGCTIADCASSSNFGNGINTGTYCAVADCVAMLNSGSGITLSLTCTASNCLAGSNSAHGISVDFHSMVADCNAVSNDLDGIRCTSDCLIRDNDCTVNGGGGSGAGIHSLGGANRIEGNNCTGADRGIDVDSAFNIIIKNTCSGNTVNWDIAANNFYGPIINRSGGTAVAQVGNGTGVDALTSTHPNANFTY